MQGREGSGKTAEQGIHAVLARDPRKVYDLADGQPNSHAFYRDLEEFAEDVVCEAEFRAAPLLDEYAEYLRFSTDEPARARGEYALELLTLGMVLRVYSTAAAHTRPGAVSLAQTLLQVRRRFPRLKPAADLARGCLFRAAFATPAESTDPGLVHLDRIPRLLCWLEATGEFREETTRLQHWHLYLRTADTHAASTCLETATAFFDWFAVEAAEALGRYTRGVRPFLAQDFLRRGIREDRFFCGRKPVEYHLGMVAAQVMNEALRPAFEECRERVLLVPTCMRGARADRCMAIRTGPDLLCMGCDPACQVHQVSQDMRDEGVRVYLVPHATGFSQQLERWQREMGVAVAAVACALNILPGGYEMRRRGIPSQCLLLDHPGCRKHWCSQNLSTRVNQEKLVQLVAGNWTGSPAGALPPQLG
ncbi:DUF116 domain-containing protein [Acidobacteria bacterium AB60]|nr:DUF116 domain-containing protein [Acidobacteria bacterium AB60]